MKGILFFLIVIKFCSPLIAQPTLLDVNGSIRAHGNTSPASGSGLELIWDGANSYVTSYGRSGGSFLPIILSASTIKLIAGGSVALSVGSDQTAAFAKSIDASGVVRASGNTSPTSGSGVELAWDGTNGYVFTYNRSGGSFLPTRMYGSTLGFFTGSGTEAVSIGSDQATTFLNSVRINGNIAAKKMIITQIGWGDYVFDKKYTLRSISSLEAFIHQHRRLPEIPSAKEVEEKGISVGDNQALLLKKIEELTLYIIEQNKKIDAIIKENKRLSIRIKASLN